MRSAKWNACGRLAPVHHDVNRRTRRLFVGGGEHQEALAVAGDDIWAAAAPGGTDRMRFKERFGNSCLEGRPIGLYVHGKVLRAEVVVKLLAVAAPSGKLPTRRGYLPFAARLRRVQREALHIDILLPRFVGVIADTPAIGRELTLL